MSSILDGSKVHEDEGDRVLSTLKNGIRRWAPEGMALTIILSLLGFRGNEGYDILKQVEIPQKGLSEDRINHAIKLATQGKALMKPTDMYGNTALHLAYFYEARLVVEILLEQLAALSDDPQQAVKNALESKNKELKTPNELCSPSFAKQIEEEVIDNILNRSTVSYHARLA